MSYANAQSNPADRAKAVLAVGTIHAALAAGLIGGLAVTTEIFIDKDFKAEDYTEVPLDPPPPPPEPETDVIPEPLPAPYNPPVAPKPLIELTPPTSGIETVGPDIKDFVATFPPPENNLAVEPAKAITAPIYPPKGATPRNGPLGWISTDDYPASELRRGNEGTAAYRLVIGSDGKVDTCEITRSSGHKRLDSATCRHISKRAKFDPATDKSGKSVVGTFSGQVAWDIPE